MWVTSLMLLRALNRYSSRLQNPSMKFVARTLGLSSRSEARNRPLWDDSPGRFVEQLSSREIIHIAAGEDVCARANGTEKTNHANLSCSIQFWPNSASPRLCL